MASDRPKTSNICGLGNPRHSMEHWWTISGSKTDIDSNLHVILTATQSVSSNGPNILSMDLASVRMAAARDIILPMTK